MSSFKNKHVLITGGAGGIGLLMGKQALQRGAHKLIIWDVDKSNVVNAKQQLAKYSDRVSFYLVDVSAPDEIYQTAQQVLAQHDKVDILINNAGIVVGKHFNQHTQKDIQNVIAINLLGVMHTTKAFLSQMVERNVGHIVNIASAAGRMANPHMAVYAGSKWGVIGWSESLRLELEQYTDLRVTIIEPSYIDTGLFEGVTPPILTPLLDSGDISKHIIRAVEKNKIHLRAPFMVKILPFLKGVLPTRVFDFVAGKLFQVYHSMDTYTGRTSKSD